MKQLMDEVSGCCRRRLTMFPYPDFVHIFIDGNIVESGSKDLSDKLEKEGYESYL